MFTGIDIGSSTTKIVHLDDDLRIVKGLFTSNQGRPLKAMKDIVIAAFADRPAESYALGITGSGRKLGARCIETDLVINEITAIWRAATSLMPDVATIIEIGGQDSKFLTIENGEISQFRLNSVCAAGTGSFLMQQSARLGLSLEEMSTMALKAPRKARFSGRCTVFVETEMINLQQQGYSLEEISAGLFDAVCENYIKDLTPGLAVRQPCLFCGGVSEIPAMSHSFSSRLGFPIFVPEHPRLLAALGAALLAHDEAKEKDAFLRKHPLDFHENSTETIPTECEKSDCLNCGKCGRLKPLSD